MKRIMKWFVVLSFVLFMFMPGITAGPESVYAAVKQPKKLELNMKNAEISAGCKVKLNVKSVQPGNASKQVVWSSSDKKIAQVSKAGVVKGKKAGTATITAKSKKNPKVTAKCKVKVYQATKTIKLNSKNTYTLFKGGQVKLSAKVTNPAKGAQPIQWSSKNSKIAKVNAKGQVTAVSHGTTNIIGKSGKKSVKVKITVRKNAQDDTQTPEPEQIDASGDGWYILNGTLYLSKIYYYVQKVVGNYYCMYENPWAICEYGKQITRIEIDADMVYTEKQYAEIYENVDHISFQGGGLLFGNMPALESVSIKRLNLDKIKDISYMFANNGNLATIDVSGLDISGVTSAARVFFNDSALTYVNLQNWKTSNLTTIEGIFEDCTNLRSVSVSSWNTGRIKNFRRAFYNCSSMASVDLGGWVINDADVSAMLYGCSLLSDVNLTDVTLWNTITSNAMFDENNSIKSYLFAADWNIREEEFYPICVIADDCYSATVYADFESGIIVETIYYKKLMPAWYKQSVEYMQSVDNFEHIYASLQLDIYEYHSGGSASASEVSASDVISSCIECLGKIEAIDSDDAALINNVIDKLNILAEWKDGNISLDDIGDLLEMSKEELEILKNTQEENE